LSGLHTFYTGTKVDGDFGKEELLGISMASITMETIKRYILGNGNVTSDSTDSIAVITSSALGGSQSGSGKIAQMTTSIEEALAGGDDRDVALEQIRDAVIFERGRDGYSSTRCSGCVLYPMEPLLEDIEFWKNLFPAVSTTDSWADDFITLLEFWTGSISQNDALIQDDTVLGWNYLELLESYSSAEVSCDTWKMVYTQGVSPRLILNTLEPISLSPNFTDIILHSSNMTFDNKESWNMPEGEKPELFYTYRKTKPLTPSSVANTCFNTDTLPALLSDLSNSFNLTSKETDLVTKELTGRIPTQENQFSSFSIANPQDIAQRFSWKGNNKPLNISQLFFERNQETCSEYSFAPTSKLSHFPLNRDGFEVGIVE